MKKIIISIIILIILIAIISIIYSRTYVVKVIKSDNNSSSIGILNHNYQKNILTGGIDAYIKEAFPKDSILIIFQGNGFVEYQSSPAKWSGNYYIIKIK